MPPGSWQVHMLSSITYRLRYQPNESLVTCRFVWCLCVAQHAVSIRCVCTHYKLIASVWRLYIKHLAPIYQQTVDQCLKKYASALSYTIACAIARDSACFFYRTVCGRTSWRKIMTTPLVIIYSYTVP